MRTTIDRFRVAGLLATLTVAAGARAQGPPIREVTVFKDGHALVLAEGAVRVGPSGVVLDALPRPVLGGFWPYVAEPGATLRSVVAGWSTRPGSRPATTLRDLLRANLGRRATVNTVHGERIEGTVDAVIDGNPGVVLLRGARSTKAIDPTAVRDIAFDRPPLRTIPLEERTNRLVLSIDGVRGPTARIGLLTLQKGIRWIPSYRIELDGAGEATVALQATLVNELADLDGATANLVVGAPSIAFQDQADPMAIAGAVARLSPFFENNGRMSNAIAMGQSAGFAPDGSDAGPVLPTDNASGERAEDLFVFPLKDVKLARGERAAYPIARAAVPYRDVYRLDLPPVAENAPGIVGGDPVVARAAARVKVRHLVRLENRSPQPFTTAPALLFSRGRMISQGTITYTPRGASSEISLADSLEIVAERFDRETGRIPDAIVRDGTRYARVDMESEIRVSSRLPKPVRIEVARGVAGAIDSVDDGGTARTVDVAGGEPLPSGWNLVPLLAERARLAGLGLAEWSLDLVPGAPRTLRVRWHWFVR